jgi:hypothetical protein
MYAADTTKLHVTTSIYAKQYWNFTAGRGRLRFWTYPYTDPYNLLGHVNMNTDF